MTIDSSNVVTFKKIEYTQNITLKNVEGRCIMEAKKFPVGAKVSVRPVLKSINDSAFYFIIIDYDQGHAEGNLLVTVKNNKTQEADIGPLGPFLPVDITLPLNLLIVASVIAVVYYLLRVSDKKKTNLRNRYLRKLNNELYRYYASQKESKIKNECLQNFRSIRTNIIEDMQKRRIRDSDFETLENKILENMEKLNGEQE
jgi:hypothetical protein